MNPDLLAYYEQELKHIREMAGEFAQENPKLAGRLALNTIGGCDDPYVERLLEGFAYLAARVQLKVDAEFPRFTQHLLDIIYPHYLAPTPSMTVVQFHPDLQEGSLHEGFSIPQKTVLRSNISKGEQTACEYSTAHDLTLWPLELVAADYLANMGAVTNAVSGYDKNKFSHFNGLKAGIRLRLKCTAGLKFNQLRNFNQLPLYLHGNEETPMQIYEQLLAHSIGLVIQPTHRAASWQFVSKENTVCPLGFAEKEALLPYTPQSFQGYRLLQEYFAFPERYLFVELHNLAPAWQQANEDEVDIIILLNQANPQLIHAVNKACFKLFCTPAINLFTRQAGRIHLTPQTHEYHVVPDRTRPVDYEVYQIQEVIGYGSSHNEQQTFLPFYQAGSDNSHRQRAYYSVMRLPRKMSSQQKNQGSRSHYIENEVFIALVDSHNAPFSSELRQLGLKILCTNRHLPLQLATNGKTDFTIQTGAPVKAIGCLIEPTKPRPSCAHKETAWKLINHLSLNYLSLVNENEKEGAAAFRSLLSLYADNDLTVRKQIEGISAIQSKPIVRRISNAGPIVFGRGLEITITVDESAFTGSGVFLLGMVLDHFFAQYVSLNSFTETVLKTPTREIKTWPARSGQRHLS